MHEIIVVQSLFLRWHSLFILSGIAIESKQLIVNNFEFQESDNEMVISDVDTGEFIAKKIIYDQFV